MKICVEGSIFESEGRGTAKATAALYTAINKIYPEIEIFLLQQNESRCSFCPKHTVIRPSFFMFKKRCDEQFFPKQVKKLSPDFAHFPINGAYSTFYKDVRPQTKIITTIHDIIPLVIPHVYKTSAKRIAEYAKNIQSYLDTSDIITTISEYSKQDLTKHFKCNSEPIVIYNAPILEKPQNTANSYGDYFLYNGGYCHRKGIEHLLENFLQLKLRDKLKSKLILTGTIEVLSPKLRALINYGVSRNWIIEKGYVSDEELAGLFLHAIALIYPSLYEGFGLPPLEAMNLGCPVITTRLSSIPEICGDAAYYINREDEADFQRALIALENDTHLRDMLIQKGLTQATKFSWEKSATEFIKLLQKTKGA